MSRPIPAPLDILGHFKDYYMAYQIGKGLSYSAFTLLIWDVLLTFGDEVRYVWSAKFTLVKGLFFFNRYISPLIISINLWTFTGRAAGLTDNFCRIWLSILDVTQVIGISLVSLIVTFRLYALEEITRTAFTLLLLVWGIALAIAMLLLVKNFFLKLETIHVLPVGNVCYAVLPRIWENWLPNVAEHAIFFLFLLFKSLKTPRSAQTPLLAIMYRHGIFYFAFTLTVFVLSFVTWRYLDLKWFSVPLLSTWIMCQVATSRLLLGVKSSQAFQHFLSSSFSGTRTTGTQSAPEYISGIRTTALPAVQRAHEQVNISSVRSRESSWTTSIPLRSFPAMTAGTSSSRPKSGDKGDSAKHRTTSKYNKSVYINAASQFDSHLSGEETEADEAPSVLHGLPEPEVHPQVHKDLDRLQSEESEPTRGTAGESSRLHRVWSRLPWWLMRGSHHGDLHIQVAYDEDVVEMADWEASGASGPAGLEGGLRVSKLGRYDHWL